MFPLKMKTCVLYLMAINILCLIHTVSLDRTFERMLREHHLDVETIQILEEQKIVNIEALKRLSEYDINDLGLTVGQRALLRQLIKELIEDNAENEMSETQFWCIFKCLGGISAVGIGGILALIVLVTSGLPVIGFGAVIAGSLAAKIMALYGGTVVQSVTMAGMTAVKKTCTHCMDL